MVLNLVKVYFHEGQGVEEVLVIVADLPFLSFLFQIRGEGPGLGDISEDSIDGFLDSQDELILGALNCVYLTVNAGQIVQKVDNGRSDQNQRIGALLIDAVTNIFKLLYNLGEQR